MGRYAEHTKVPVSRSRDEVERTLVRYGAKGLFVGQDEGIAVIGFRLQKDGAVRVANVKVILPIESDCHSKAEFERRLRRSWRVLVMTLKAKLEAVESGISTFDKEFLADLVLGDGSTIGEFMLPQVDEVYRDGKSPKLLPGLSTPSEG